MAKIEIITRDVDSNIIRSLPDQMAPQHTFLLYTDDYGKQEVIRGGQFSDFKSNEHHKNQLYHGNSDSGDLLIVYNKKYDISNGKESIDYHPNYQSFPSSTVILASDNIVSQIWDSMTNEGQRINNGGYDYELLHQNCNTALAYMVKAGERTYNSLLQTANQNQYSLAVDSYNGLKLPSDNGNEYWTPGLDGDFNHSLLELFTDGPKQINNSNYFSNADLDLFKLNENGKLTINLKDPLSNDNTKLSDLFKQCQAITNQANQITIKPGDTLSEIAQKHGTTIEDLQSLNNIDNPDQINAGDTLKLKADSNPEEITIKDSSQDEAKSYKILEGSEADDYLKKSGITRDDNYVTTATDEQGNTNTLIDKAAQTTLPDGTKVKLHELGEMMLDASKSIGTFVQERTEEITSELQNIYILYANKGNYR